MNELIVVLSIAAVAAILASKTTRATISTAWTSITQGALKVANGTAKAGKGFSRKYIIPAGFLLAATMTNPIWSWWQHSAAGQRINALTGITNADIFFWAMVLCALLTFFLSLGQKVAAVCVAVFMGLWIIGSLADLQVRPAANPQKTVAAVSLPTSVFVPKCEDGYQTLNLPAKYSLTLGWSMNVLTTEWRLSETGVWVTFPERNITKSVDAVRVCTSKSTHANSYMPLTWTHS